MNVLYLAHRIPYPPNKGDKIRAYHQLRGLARRHRVDLMTLIDDPADRPHVADLEQICERVVAVDLPPREARLRAGLAVLTGRAFSPPFFRQPQLARAVAERLATSSYDAIVMFCSAMGSVLPGNNAATSAPILADYCDLDSAKWRALSRHGNLVRRLLFSREAVRLARYEVSLARACRTVTFATPLEAEDFGALPGAAGATDVRVVPNGVDHALFARGDRLPSSDPTVVLTGAMDYLPNHEGALWFLDRVWPRVRREMPNARMRIVGRDPRPELCARDGSEGVEITGTVPDIRPALHDAWISVAPLQVARGVQNKVLEAMAAGVPTVISPAVSRGLAARTGIETMVVEHPRDWAATVIRLLGSPALRQGLLRAGREYVREHHDWDAHADAWEDILERSLSDTLERRGAA